MRSLVMEYYDIDRNNKPACDRRHARCARGAAAAPLTRVAARIVGAAARAVAGSGRLRGNAAAPPLHRQWPRPYSRDVRACVCVSVCVCVCVCALVAV